MATDLKQKKGEINQKKRVTAKEFAKHKQGEKDENSKT